MCKVFVVVFILLLYTSACVIYIRVGHRKKKDNFYYSNLGYVLSNWFGCNYLLHMATLKVCCEKDRQVSS